MTTLFFFLFFGFPLFGVATAEIGSIYLAGFIFPDALPATNLLKRENVQKTILAHTPPEIWLFFAIEARNGLGLWPVPVPRVFDSRVGTGSCRVLPTISYIKIISYLFLLSSYHYYYTCCAYIRWCVSPNICTTILW